ncbi:UbiA family prenyltransferase [Runella slithyformis]|uniref:UbiA prenyltransferase n=1 Tax=Runella slithyformis (strain ATCC 29530 / DSM 19594 / LMG 11500 / NCIMB 11436 / LSU 4) TaxID=761193 RepID=A0A7U4E764_RUNSL|nr:UbiA family prenyltransferase [Runella slithyformis]AEI50336.1 UbiA prenyltransferase [Runella slithyformis DSM 19594]
MKNILLHLRIPFSFFLLPIFLFAVSQSPHPEVARAWWVFLILHLLLFPASNAYNSYYDKDEGSIGLLESPPPVTKELFYVAWAFDILALVLGWLFVGEVFTLYLVVYGFISKAYSHPLIRLKKYPVLSWIIVTFFQGALTYWAVYQAINPSVTFESLTSQWIPALVCTSNLLAIYPLTQVYQHEEDARRGDMTMSRLLGIKGTFINANAWLLLSGIGYVSYFGFTVPLLLLVLLLFPLLAFFGWWTWKVWQDERNANFKNTMWLNLLASVCLNVFFGILCFL